MKESLKEVNKLKDLEEYKSILNRYTKIRNYFQEKVVDDEEGKDYDNIDRIYQNRRELFKIKHSCIEEAYNVLHSAGIDSETKNNITKRFFNLYDNFGDLIIVGLIFQTNRIAAINKKKRKSLFNRVNSNLRNMTKIGVPH